MAKLKRGKWFILLSKENHLLMKSQSFRFIPVKRMKELSDLISSWKYVATLRLKGKKVIHNTELCFGMMENNYSNEKINRKGITKNWRTGEDM